MIPHPDELLNQQQARAITRGGKQALEDKAVAAYMKVFEETGKAEAEKVFFNHFNMKPWKSRTLN